MKGAVCVLALVAIVAMTCGSALGAMTFKVSHDKCAAQLGALTIPASKFASRRAAQKADLIANGASRLVADIISRLFFGTMPRDISTGDYCYTNAKRLQLVALNELSFGSSALPFKRDQATFTAMYDAEVAFLNSLQAGNNETSRQMAATSAKTQLDSMAGRYDDIVWNPTVQRYQCVESAQNFIHPVCAQETCAFCDTVASTNDPLPASGCLGASNVIQNGLNEPTDWTKRYDWRRRVYLNCLAQIAPTNNAVEWLQQGVGDAFSYAYNDLGNACPTGTTWSFQLSSACTKMLGN